MSGAEPTWLGALRRELEGRYQIQDELGRGAMARVFRARGGDGTTVALKVLPTELASSTNAERFSREIRITARLRHANILPLIDSGVAGQIYWYVMPLVEGESLRTRLRNGPLALGEAVDVGRQVATALVYAHEHGIIHRDLKPENLMRAGEQWVVLDFGLARALEGDTRLTGVNMPLGTPAYISPEQILAAAEVDGRADIYGLGCVLFETLTGRPPFVSASVVNVLRSQMQEQPVAPSSLRPEVPAALDQAVLRALAKDPEKRQRDAAALLAELDALAGTVPAPRRSGILGRLFGR